MAFPRFIDDLAGVAGGALSVLAGLREELESQMRARVDEAIRNLDLVRKEEMEVVAELAANARAGQEAAEARIERLEARVLELEAGLAARSGGSAGMDGTPSAGASPSGAPGTGPV